MLESEVEAPLLAMPLEFDQSGGNLTLRSSSPTRRKSYGCEVCPAMFGSRMELEEHSNSHTGEKPFECDVCLARFNRRSTLWNHKRIHSDTRPFTCPVCGMKFKWKNSLKCHKEMHLRKNETGNMDLVTFECAMKAAGAGNSPRKNGTPRKQARRKTGKKLQQQDEEASHQSIFEGSSSLDGEINSFSSSPPSEYMALKTSPMSNNNNDARAADANMSFDSTRMVKQEVGSVNFGSILQAALQSPGGSPPPPDNQFASTGNSATSDHMMTATTTSAMAMANNNVLFSPTAPQSHNHVIRQGPLTATAPGMISSSQGSSYYESHHGTVLNNGYFPMLRNQPSFGGIIPNNNGVQDVNSLPHGMMHPAYDSQHADPYPAASSSADYMPNVDVLGYHQPPSRMAPHGLSSIGVHSLSQRGMATATLEGGYMVKELHYSEW